MRELSASEILGVWERGRSRSLPERALELLAAGGHPEPPELLPVGERDALLVELRELTFGPSLQAVVECPSCAEPLEIELAGGELRGERAATGPLELDVGGSVVRLRLPTAGDLVAVAAAAGVEAGRRVLLERVVVGGELDPGLEDAVVERLAEADPGASTELALECPGCGATWSAPFDIVSFLWAELDAFARRLVGDVHALASAYGWTEGDVLALGPARRKAYLEYVGA
jgi:hypothetical protein